LPKELSVGRGRKAWFCFKSKWILGIWSCIIYVLHQCLLCEFVKTLHYRCFTCPWLIFPHYQFFLNNSYAGYQ
jgi:hypothetical protein